MPHGDDGRRGCGRRPEGLARARPAWKVRKVYYHMSAPPGTVSPPSTPLCTSTDWARVRRAAAGLGSMTSTSPGSRRSYRARTTSPFGTTRCGRTPPRSTPTATASPSRWTSRSGLADGGLPARPIDGAHLDPGGGPVRWDRDAPAGHDRRPRAAARSPAPSLVLLHLIRTPQRSGRRSEPDAGAPGWVG